jgi:hypothetical protein
MKLYSKSSAVPIIACILTFAVVSCHGAGFLSPEHRRLGDSVFADVLGDLNNADNEHTKQFVENEPKDHTLVLENGLKTTYGSIVSAFGDYIYWDRPMSLMPRKDAERDFQLAWKRISGEDVETARKEMHNAKVLADSLEDLMKDSVNRGSTASRYFSKPLSAIKHIIGTVTDPKDSPYSNRVEAAFENAAHHASFWSTRLRYGTSIDHFAKWARRVYQAGMTDAYSVAARAGQIAKSPAGANKDKKKWQTMLRDAIGLSAAAAHQYTDLFAAGHIRSPVEAVTKQCGSLIAAHLCMGVHNEDGDRGLFVKNDAGNEWKTYGDSHLYEPLAADTLKYASKGLKVHIMSVFEAFQNAAAPSGFPAMKYLPHAKEDNFPALLILDSSKNQVMMRKTGPHERKNPKYQKLSCVWSALNKLFLAPRCYDQDGTDYVLAEGACERKGSSGIWGKIKTTFDRCNSASDCQPKKGVGCSGTCVCGKHRLNDCRCVRPAVDHKDNVLCKKTRPL